jgi:hypothetical protein
VPSRNALVAPSIDEAVRNAFGMQPNMNRLNLLPRYNERDGLVAPNALYQLARAMVAPGVAAQGGYVSEEDAINFAGNVSLGGLGASAAMRNAAPGPGKTVAQTVYHSSPHAFDAFDISKIGTGDGTQGFGHGLYFAESPSVGGKDGTYYRQFSSGGKKPTAYTVDLPDEQVAQMMDWDNPPTTDSPQAVKDGLNAIARKFPGLKDEYFEAVRKGEPGWWFYSRLTQEAAKHRPPDFSGDKLAFNQKFASDAFKEAGILGMRYLDGFSRSAGSGTSNFVVFDDSLPKILNKE